MKQTQRLCAGITAGSEEAPCRLAGRWFKVASDKAKTGIGTLVCEAHLGWALAKYGTPARVERAPDEE